MARRLHIIRKIRKNTVIMYVYSQLILADDDKKIGGGLSRRRRKSRKNVREVITVK